MPARSRALGAALTGAFLFAWLLHRNATRHQIHRAPDPGRGIFAALWPYVLLTALVVPARAVPGVSELLAPLALEWQWDRFSGRVQLLTHPGTLLALALLGGAALQRAPVRALPGSLGRSARRLLPVAVALLAMLCLSRLMLHAGMIQALQHAAVATVGLAGREGSILARTVWPCAVYLLAGGAVLSLLLSWAKGWVG